MPSTSVQISIRSAFRAAPMMAAEKSDPPLPSVVGMPSCVAAIKPPITGMRFLPRTGLTFTCRCSFVASNKGRARVCIASLTIHSRASTQTASKPRAARAAATISLESNSPNDSRQSLLRGESSRTAATPRTKCSNSSATLSTRFETLEQNSGSSRSFAVSRWRSRIACSNCRHDSQSPEAAC